MLRIIQTAIVIVGTLAWSNPAAVAAVVTINPWKDATIYEPEGGASNGTAPLFSGRTGTAAGFTTRRAMMAFNIAANVPAGATIQAVTLTLQVLRKSKDSNSADNYLLHPLTVNWGEGATGGAGGGGDPAGAGDATWTSNLFGTSTWTVAGGDYAAVASGSIGLDAPGSYTSQSSAGLVNAVQGWLDNPATNFGWILIAQDENANSAREFASREATDTGTRPTLTVTYVPEPTMSGLVMLTLGLAMLRRRRQFR